MEKLFFRAAPKGKFFLRKKVQKPKKTHKSSSDLWNGHRDPRYNPKKLAFWLKIGSGVNTLIEGQILPPSVFPHSFYFHPIFLGGWFAGVSCLEEGVFPSESTGSRITFLFYPSSVFFVACLQNEIAFKLEAMAPATGRKNFPSFSTLFFFFFFFENFEKLKSVWAFIIDQLIAIFDNARAREMNSSAIGLHNTDWPQVPRSEN